MGLFSKLGSALGLSESSSAKRAREEANRIAQETLRQQQEATLLQQNQQSILTANTDTDAAASIVAGGTADALGLDTTTTRKRQASGVASTLGLNV